MKQPDSHPTLEPASASPPVHAAHRRGRPLIAVALLAMLAGLSACSQEQGATAPQPVVAAAVDTERLIQADSEPGNWMTHGRTYSEQRFSPLGAINADNVGSLGLAWYSDLDTRRGQEATPLVIDGTMYVSTAWSKVKALDAATGKLLWEYDPGVPGAKAVDACCDVVNRGVAAWKGRVYVGALDGRLIALDAATGKELWSTQTTDTDWP